MQSAQERPKEISGMSESRTATPAASRRPNNVRRTSWAGVVGSVVEYYDFTLFGLAAAVVFGKLFFPEQDPAAGTISALLTFAIGYFGRPIGGLIFSHLGDRIGRKPMLIWTLLLMGAATFAVGLLPTYDAIGLWAPILLALCRILQGMGAGAEYVGSLVMLAESGDKRREGFRVALPGMGVFAGIVIATAVFAVVSTLPEEALLSWGWRVPFLASVVTVGVALWIRVGITETEEFTDLKGRGDIAKVPVFDALRTQWREVIIGYGIIGPYLAFSSLTQVYLLSYLTGTMGLPASFGLMANLISSALAVGLVPLFGLLGDLLGRRRVWLAGCGIFVIFGALAFPLLGTENEVVIILTMVLGISIGLASLFAIQGALLAGLFAPRHRLSGIVIVREPAAALIAGPSPAFAAWLVSLVGGDTWPVSALFIGAAVIAAITVILGRRRLDHDRSEGALFAQPTLVGAGS
jgi:MHS family shikimate/dehydroshikimate transporter-like MFS transporter